MDYDELLGAGLSSLRLSFQKFRQRRNFRDAIYVPISLVATPIMHFSAQFNDILYYRDQDHLLLGEIYDFLPRSCFIRQKFIII